MYGAPEIEITVYRPVKENDEYGDPKPVGPVATWPSIGVLSGRYAPSNPSEGLEPGRNTVISGGVVYIVSDRPAVSGAIAPTDIRDSDAVGILGTRYAVDGKLGYWGTGVQFAVKAAS